MYFLRSETFKDIKIQFEVYKMKILDFADFLKIPLWDFFMTHNFGYLRYGYWTFYGYFQKCNIF